MSSMLPNATQMELYSKTNFLFLCYIKMKTNYSLVNAELYIKVMVPNDGPEQISMENVISSLIVNCYR